MTANPSSENQIAAACTQDVRGFGLSVASGSPLSSLNGVTFWPVPEFTDVEIAFGPRGGESAYLPRRNLPSVPRELEDLVQGLFFKGGALPELSSQVDAAKAMRAVKAWLRSFAPAHESKITTVAYALWVWTTLARSNTETSQPRGQTHE